MHGQRGQHRAREEFWGGPPWAGGAGWRGGRRMRRGDIRQALLRALQDGPAHGYEVMRRLEERSSGLWRPSAGSVYPTLQLLEEQGLLTSREEGGKRIYELTDEGRTEIEATAAGGPPWETAEGTASGRHALRGAVVQLHLAAKQVAMTADDTGVERATAVLKEARQKLYQLLAED
jgi:DNA-binding PadR family transcriptional regulator